MTDKLNESGLKELFGRAIMFKLISAPAQFRRVGKHAKSRNQLLRPHPAGTKFVRRCIRNSGRESHANRVLYAYMTGHQYEGTSK